MNDNTQLVRHFCLLGALFLGLSTALPLHGEAHELVEWAQNKNEEIQALDGQPRSADELFNQPYLLSRLKTAPVVVEDRFRSRNKETMRLYRQLVGSSSEKNFLWSGIESGNPLTRNEEYRWDSLQDQGLFDPHRRSELIDSLQTLGIRNIRMGMSNHRINIDDGKSWSDHDRLIGDLAAGGLNISLDLHHFGIEDRFRVVDAKGHTSGASSYYLNAAWPDYFARFAAEAFRRYGASIKAITLINEPETTVGFNSEMWHGAFPRWSSSQNNFFYIERAVQVAKAAVKARMAIEEEMQLTGQQVFFVHPEAAVYKPSWEDFNRFNRFVTSDLILGKEWLMEADLDALARRPMADIVGAWQRMQVSERSQLDWMIENYVVYNQPAEVREKNRRRLVTLLAELRALHQGLHERYGITMRSNTVFGIDYYAHNEDRDPDGMRLRPRPELYDEQVRAGRRAGLYRVIVDYFNRYQMPVMITETGTPFYHYGMRWHQQMLLACADAMASGVPFLGYTMYPAVDTWGWETALSVPKSETLLNPGGVLDLRAKPKPFVERLLSSLSEYGLAAPQEPAVVSASETPTSTTESVRQQEEPAPL